MGRLIEEPGSRSIDFGVKDVKSTRMYHLLGYTSETAALNALISGSPAVISILGVLLSGPREFKLDPVNAPTDTTQSVWKGTVSYSTPGGSNEKGDEQEPQTPQDESSIEFDFSSMTDFKFDDPEQSTYIDMSGDAIPDKFTGINQPDPSVPPQGAEINVAICNFTLKTVFAQSVVTNKWLKARMDQVWTLNAQTFRSLPPKSVALTGMSGSQRADKNWDITYTFEYRPVRGEEVIGNQQNRVKVPETTGWQYTWAEYTEFKEETKAAKPPANQNDSTKTWRKLSRVHVADLYSTSNFSSLGIVTK